MVTSVAEGRRDPVPVHAFPADRGGESTAPRLLLCAVLGVTRAGCYAWRERCPSPPEREDEKLQALIRCIFSGSQESYAGAHSYGAGAATGGSDEPARFKDR
jgi:hypothetical protein